MLKSYTAGKAGRPQPATRTTGAAGRATVQERRLSRSRPRRSSSSRRSRPARSTSRCRCRSRTSRSSPRARKYSLLVRQTSSLNYVGFFNTTRPPLDNVLVRRALVVCDARTRTSSRVGSCGYGSQARSAGPVGIFPWSAKTPQYTHEHGQGEGAARAVRPQAGGFSTDLDLRRREPGRGTLRAADQGRVREDRRQGDAEVDPVQPAVGRSRRAIPRRPRTCSCSSTGRRTATPARTTCGRSSTAAQKPFFNLSYWKSPPTTSSSTTRSGDHGDVGHEGRRRSTRRRCRCSTTRRRRRLPVRR